MDLSTKDLFLSLVLPHLPLQFSTETGQYSKGMHHIYGISRLGSDPWAVPENLDAKRRVVGKASIHFKSLFRSILRNLLESVHLPFYKKCQREN